MAALFFLHRNSTLFQIGDPRIGMGFIPIWGPTYTLTFSGLEDMGIFTEYLVSNKKENPPLKCICGISVYAATQFHQRRMTTVTCYTSCNMTLENRNVTFCSTCNFGDDGEWYNWCLVEWIDDDEERNTYPGKILGFFTMEGSVYDVL